MLKLKLQYFGHLMQRVDSLEKTLMLGGIGGRRRGDNRGWDGRMASLTRWTWVWVNSRSCRWTGRPGVLQFVGLQKSDMTEQLNWLTLCFSPVSHIYVSLSFPLLQFSSIQFPLLSPCHTDHHSGSPWISYMVPQRLSKNSCNTNRVWPALSVVPDML